MVEGSFWYMNVKEWKPRMRNCFSLRFHCSREVRTSGGRGRRGKRQIANNYTIKKLKSSTTRIGSIIRKESSPDFSCGRRVARRFLRGWKYIVTVLYDHLILP